AFVRKFGMGRDPVGMRMAVGSRVEPDIEIVGVVRDAKYHLVKQEVPPQFFLPYREDEDVGAMHHYRRTPVRLAESRCAIPRVVAAVDPNLPVEDLARMTQQVSDAVFIDRMIGALSAAFAGVATLLAAFGLYGVLAY